MNLSKDRDTLFKIWKDHLKIKFLNLKKFFKTNDLY